MELFQCLLKLLQKSKNYRAKSEALDKNENFKTVNFKIYDFIP